jgi:hypothetical protein
MTKRVKILVAVLVAVIVGSAGLALYTTNPAILSIETWTPVYHESNPEGPTPEDLILKH